MKERVSVTCDLQSVLERRDVSRCGTQRDIVEVFRREPVA
jgi:hypothetical protein